MADAGQFDHHGYPGGVVVGTGCQRLQLVILIEGDGIEMGAHQYQGVVFRIWRRQHPFHVVEPLVKCSDQPIVIRLVEGINLGGNAVVLKPLHQILRHFAIAALAQGEATPEVLQIHDRPQQTVCIDLWQKVFDVNRILRPQCSGQNSASDKQESECFFHTKKFSAKIQNNKNRQKKNSSCHLLPPPYV